MQQKGKEKKMSKVAITRLWVNQILSGRKNYGQVPEGLRKEVKGELERAGRQELAVEEN